MKQKNAPAQFAPEPDAGVFEAIVSVFNNTDMAGDIVRPGAFTKTLAHWKSSGSPIPVYWSHRLDDPTYNIGYVLDAYEMAGGDKSIPDWASEHVRTNGGLYVKAQLDDYGMGQHVGRLLKARRVNQFSFSYDEIDTRKAKDGTTELLDLWVHEVGPTPLGCNPLTELLAAKARERPTPAPPPDPDPPTEPDEKPRKNAGLFACRVDIARWQYELAD